MAIHQLDDDTIRKIAAGEVVERPASVVKELVENSLDADASRIDVGIEAGGTERVRVADDGVGMTREEAELAVQEHTTSKIEDVEDLESGVATLGFRGEALHAISAVSRTTITTKPRGGDRATEIEVDHGEVVSVEPAGRPEGTTVDVREIFRETPARRKFLKTESTEFDHVNRIVTRYALANPDTSFSLVHDDREVFSTTGQDDLEGAILSVYGREVAESMIEVDSTVEAGSIDRVSGFVSHPETNRSTREYVSTFVNDRYVTASTLRNAIVEAYGGQLAADRYPFAVLFLEIEPDAVDVNVHPRKLEVRFDDEEGVRESVREAVESALLDHGLIRSSAPRGRSAPDETAVISEGGDVDEAEAAVETTPESEDGGDRPGSPPEPSDPDSGVRKSVPDEASSSEPGWGSDRTTASSTGDTGTRSDRSSRSSSSGPAGSVGTPDDGGAGEAEDSPGSGHGRICSSGTQRTLDDEAVDRSVEFDSLPAMRVLGQLHDTYVVAETAEGLLLIDQHAADERINYERLRGELDAPATQALAEPVEIELTAREAALFPDFEDALEDLGFRASLSGERTVEVSAVPAIFDDAFDPELLRDVLGEFLDGAEETSVDSRVDELLADLACYPSITGNTSLAEGSIRDLLEALAECENPYACPHGRPVFVEIDAGEIEERFERDYPGHQN